MLGVDDIKQLELTEMTTDDDDQRFSQMPQEMVDKVEIDKQQNRTKFSDLYDNITVVGAGSFGIVVACIDKKNQQSVALKLAAYNRKCPSQAALSILRECEILAPMRHPNCIMLYDTHTQYEDYIIMEMELGGESLGRFEKSHREKYKTPLSEE